MDFGLFSNGERTNKVAAETYDEDLAEVMLADRLGFARHDRLPDSLSRLTRPLVHPASVRCPYFAPDGCCSVLTRDRARKAEVILAKL